MRENTEGVHMIFRAVFWIGLVSLLTPHEPDLGLGRPGAGTSLSLPATLLSASGLSRAADACSGACAGRLLAASGLVPAGLIPEGLRLRGGGFTASLSEIKAEIEADQRARASRNAHA